MKKIIFIYLPHPYLRQPNAQAPMGLLALAAILDKHRIPTDVKNYSCFSEDDAIRDLPEAKAYGITVTSLELPSANRFAKKIKSKYPHSKVILGGPGTYADEFVDWQTVDSILKGEGDITILNMLRDLDSNNLKKLYIGKIVDKLDSLPFPARHYLNYQGGNIFAYNKNYKTGGSTIILSSRGCPFNCAFCSAPSFTYSKRIRFRSPENVYREVKEVLDNYGIKQFRFSDDMFTASKKQVLAVSKMLGRLDVVWRISCRVKPLDIDMLKAMKDGGCVELSFGIESFDDHVLKGLKKGTTAEDNAKALDMCAKVGLKTRMLFMIRTPFQTKRTVPTNIEWIKKVPYDIIALTTFVPLPGSDIWTHPEKYDIEILNRNLDDYNFYFFGSGGENPLKDIIKLKGRTLEEVNSETQEFKNFIKSTGKLNEG